MNDHPFNRAFSFYPLIGFVTLLLVLGGCNSKKEKKEEKETETKQVVAVSSYPLMYFAERISGGNVDVTLPIEADIDPAFWKPSADAIKKMQSADLILINGAGYESWLSSATLPESKLVNTTEDSTAELIETEDEVVHQHGPDGEHSHKVVAFTTWLDPDMAISQSYKVQQALIQLSPYHQAAFDDNFRKLKSDLRDLRSEMVRVGKLLEGRHVIGSHPVYQYLQRTMNLKMHSVHFEPDENPSDTQWAKFDELLNEHPTQIMLWESQPLESILSELEKRGIKVIVFSQLGNLPKDGDLLSGLNESLMKLAIAAESLGPAEKNALADSVESSQENGESSDDSAPVDDSDPGESVTDDSDPDDSDPDDSDPDDSDPDGATDELEAPPTEEGEGN